jgi:hypothetical protein
MADDLLFIGWGSVVRGREEQALQVFGETVEYWTSARREGRIDSFEPVLLTPHGGDLAGFMLVRGTRAALDAIRADHEFERLIARAGAVVEQLGVIEAYGDEALARQFGYFQESAAALA